MCRNQHCITKPTTPHGLGEYPRDFLKFAAQSARARMGNVRMVEIPTEITKILRPGTKKFAQSRSLSHSEARKRAKRLRCGPPRAGQCIDHCGSRRYTLRDFEGKPRAEAARAVWAPFGAMSEARSRSAEPRAAARGFPEAFGVARDVAQVSRARAKSSVGTLGA